ncbi:MAG: FtsK/SpoIIIE domain-containing protein, partial [Pseudonocardiales bacterium]
VRASPGGAMLVNRPPQTRGEFTAGPVQLPAREGARPPQRVQWIAATVPALAGIALALALHSPQFLIVALMAPVVVVATSLGDRLHWRRDRRRASTSLRHREATARAEVAAGLAAETAARRRTGPDPATLYDAAAGPGVRLWERRRSDSDALTVRLGLTDLPSALQARRGSVVQPAGRVVDVPLALDLRRGPLGVAGPAEIGIGVVRWLVCQLATLHSPADLEIALLLSDDAVARWTWARWLPHVGGRVTTTPDAGHALVTELGTVIERRLASRRLDSTGWPGRWLVVVVDHARALVELPGLSALLAAGPSVGITAICLDSHGRRLPAACATCVVATGETGARLRLAGPLPQICAEFVADRVTGGWADRVARCLAPLVDAGSDAATCLSPQCRLVDVLGIDDFDVAKILDRWAGDVGCADTVLGLGVDGPVHLDLVRDGPHALVAGTTGSGKSELLQSLVAGLAVCHPPEAISFVLIDYKGGAAFADCARLPHTVGLVTDLDAQLTTRALRSLHAELARRERLFAQLNTKDLAGYRAAASPPEQLGRLVLVVDEFAALAEELPDFVSGLVAIAQRGRSLGVHLVLATQRPSGVVSPEIRANTTLRIALRVSDPAESTDVIGTDRAAHLARDAPGRAILSVGATATEMQTARVGGPADPGASHGVSIIALDEWRRPVGTPADAGDPNGKTDLQMLVDTLCRAAAVSDGGPVRRPWLPPLPSHLPVRDVSGGVGGTTVAFGLVDEPHLQRQSPLLLDLADGGSVLFTGGPRSGRSTAVATIAVSAAAQLGPGELTLYVLDFAGDALRALAQLPHCGTAVTCEPFDLAETLLRRLVSELARRQAWLAERHVGSVAEARRAGMSVPLMLCLLDGWESFVEAAEQYDAGQSAEMLFGLLRAAPAAGLTVVLAGDRGTLAARLGSAVGTKLLLRLTERADYGLAGIPARAVPTLLPSGRAVRAADAAEVQLAFVGGDPSRTELANRIAVLARRHGPAAVPSLGVGPIRLKPLPHRVSLASLPATLGRFTLGVAGDSAEAVRVDLFAGAARLLVAGAPRSGRSSMLRTLLVQAVRANVAIVVAAPRRSPLAATAEAHHIVVLAPDADADAAAEAGARPGERTLLLVDDSEVFLDTPAGNALSAAVRAAPAAFAAVVAGNSDDLALTYRGVAAEVRRNRCVLVLQPGPGDGDLLGRRVPRRRGLLPPGRGVLIGDPAWGPRFAEPLPIQVALP